MRSACRVVNLSKSAVLCAVPVRNSSRLPVRIDSDNVVHSPYPDVELSDLNLADYVWRNADRWNDKPALTDAVTGRSYTYGEARAAFERLSLSLPDSTGLKPGDTLGLVLPNSPEFAFTWFAAAATGLVVSPANPVYTAEELSRQMSNAGARAVVTSPAFLDKVRHAMELVPGGGQIIVATDGSAAQEASLASTCPDVLSLHALINREYSRHAPRLPKPDPDSLMALPYSSGTTGLPKGVCISHRNLVANLCQTDHPDLLEVKHRQGQQHVSLGILPFYHIYGMSAVLDFNLSLGRHTVTLPRFEPALFTSSISRYKPTLLSVAPPLLLFLATTDQIAKEDFLRLHCLMTGAAPATPAIIEKFMKQADFTNLDFREGWGMTETSCVGLLTPPRHYGVFKIGSAGAPVPHSQAKVVDEEGKALPVGQEGELWVRGPNIMQGYHKNDAATRETLTDDGWLKTGDVAYVDEDGLIFIVDRIKELIKVKGLQVSPTELEGVLRKMDGVADVAVVGMPDDRSGEIPRAYVVRAQGSTITENDVAAYVEARVAPFKKLAGGVRFIEAIPKSPAGKVLRRELKKLND